MRVFEHPRTILAISVLFVSFSAIFVRFSTAQPLVIAAYRMLFSTALVVPSLLKRTNRGRPSKADGALCVLAGVFLAIHFGTWIASLSLTSVAAATALVNTHPIVVAVVAWILFRERLSVREGVAVVAAVLGSAILAGASPGDPRLAGNLLALTGGVAFAGYVLIGRYVRGRVGLSVYTSIVYGASALLLLAVSLLGGEELLGLPWTDYLLFGAMALFCTILGHTLVNWALRYLGATYVGVVYSAEPVFASLLAVVLLGEVPTLRTVVGAAIVVSALFVYMQIAQRRSEA